VFVAASHVALPGRRVAAFKQGLSAVMSKLLPAIVAALTVLAPAAAGSPVRQTPSVRVGPAIEERRPEGGGDSVPAAKNDKPSADASKRTGETTKPVAETAKSNASQPSAPASTTSDATKSDGPAAIAPRLNSPANDTNTKADTKAAGTSDTNNPSTVKNPNTEAGSTGAPGTNAPGTGGASLANPAASSALPPAPPLTAVYRIGTGDVLDIRLLNLVDSRQSTLFTVLSGGVLEYPLLRNPLTVAGMTTEELSAQLVAELRHRGVYERPQVRVSVREYASHAVLVSGLVNDPGTKILRREAVPLYVVVAEAQPKPEAGRAIVISHKTGKATTVDLADPAALNLLVQQGDVVNLVARPPEFFYIGGEISSPGQKEFHAGLTLTQALLAAGGVTRTAGPKVRVSRQGADGRLVSTEYNLQEIENGTVPDPVLQPGDRVEVARPRAK
jgi:protein involved in polysaccharide export with SLBB domain